MGETSSGMSQPKLKFKMKELIDLLEEKTFHCGWAKPCEIYINQAYRQGVVVSGDKVDNYNVAYVMPNGRMYVKKVTAKDSERILKIDMWKAFNNDGTTFSAWGF